MFNSFKKTTKSIVITVLTIALIIIVFPANEAFASSESELVLANGRLEYHTNGRIDSSFTGIAQWDKDRKWYFISCGVYDETFKGLAQATNGKWYYVSKGHIDKNFSGKIVKATNGRWYYVNKGVPTKTFTGKIAQATNGTWYYCTNGRPDTKVSGVIAYCTNGGWYYVTKGKVDKSFTGIAKATNGSQYYVKNGKLDKSFSGKKTYNDVRYTIRNGKVIAPAQTPVCNHNWIWHTHTETVHKSERYLVSDAWDEPLYESHNFCNKCGCDLTTTYGGPGTSGGIGHLDNCNSGWHNESVQVGSIHHDAVYDVDEWDEEVTVKDYQYCSKCGKRK